MGYDLHITRAQEWFKCEGHEIKLQEWLEYVESDPEIQRDLLNGPNDFLFVAHPDEPAPLWWNARLGEIQTKNPDAFTINKMVLIAQKLGARVQGDDCERYDTSTCKNLQHVKIKLQPDRLRAIYEPKQHAKELLSLFERSCQERPDIPGNWRGLKCAQEIVRLAEMAAPEEHAVSALLAEFKVGQPDLGSAWLDLQLTAAGCFKKR